MYKKVHRSFTLIRFAQPRVTVTHLCSFTMAPLSADTKAAEPNTSHRTCYVESFGKSSSHPGSHDTLVQLSTSALTRQEGILMTPCPSSNESIGCSRSVPCGTVLPDNVETRDASIMGGPDAHDSRCEQVSRSCSGPSISVSWRQKGNPVLRAMRNVTWQFSDNTFGADYVLNESCCALFLSLRYHLLHPDYLLRRIREISPPFILSLVGPSRR